MDALVIAFLLSMVGCTWGGVKLIARGLRAPKPPPIPAARIANLDPADAGYAKAARVAARAPRTIGKGLAVIAGLGLIAAPWAVLYSVIKGIGELASG